METKKIIKKEVEEEVLDKLLCDNCNQEIEYANSCGFGQHFTLNDAWCKSCGGNKWDFCSFKCLKEFINKNRLEKPHKLIEKEEEFVYNKYYDEKQKGGLNSSKP